MFRRLLNSFRKPLVLIKRNSMARPRFLPNELPDFKDGAALQIPDSFIKNQIYDYIADIKNYVPPTERNGKDGLYLGSAGIAYMFYHLSKIPALSQHKTAFLTDAIEYINPALKVCTQEINDTDKAAFLLGNCGVYAVASAIFHAVGHEKDSLQYRNLYSESARVCRDMNFLRAGSDELFVGRAGYLSGALWMSKETGTPFKTEDVYDLCRIMITSGRQYAENSKSQSPLMYSYYDVEYIGAGHGICTILQMLMSVPGYLDANPVDARAVKQSVDYVLSLQDQDGNFPAATDEINSQPNELIHWCHGAGGVAYVMAKAYLLWNEDKYLAACKNMSELIWNKGLLRKGPGLCHGIAGNGYVFLLMYRLTQDDKYLHRAIQFSQFLENRVFKDNARVPDNPHSLFEGTAGTVCFLGDLLNPGLAAFPFSDVF